MSKLLEVNNLKKYFKTPAGLLYAVDDVSFSVDKGCTLGVVGESGCGKSTLGRVVLGLLEATEGQVLFEGRDITNAARKEFKELRKNMQIIFQDPYSSLNPRLCVSDLISEPLKVYRTHRNKAGRDKHVAQLMDSVGLARRLAYCYPHELDGGRRQRIGVARALALNPKFIVCDEPVSALDVSIQAQILNLLQDLQEEHQLTFIFITHNLSVVKHISNDIMVMYLGTLVEKCKSDKLFEYNLHPYTKGLLSAIPIPSIDNRRERVILRGEITSPINPKNACRFANRCVFSKKICCENNPKLREIMPEHYVACHFAEEINNLRKGTIAI